MSAVGDEMPGHAARRQVIAGVLVPRGVRAGTNAGRRRQWPSPYCLHPKSDGPHFGLRGKWRRSGFEKTLLALLVTRMESISDTAYTHNQPNLFDNFTGQ